MTVVIVSTGGTIASPTGSNEWLTGDDLVATVPELEPVADIETHSFDNLPSTNMTFARMYELVELLGTFDDDASVDGIVVTHGTDVLEESAYFADLCYDGETPVIFTGAMRDQSMVAPDGPANLLASVRTATTERARGLGVLVVLNDRVHPAKGVTKTHSMALDTFQSPEFGPLATVDHDRIAWERTSAPSTPTYDPDPEQLTNDVPAIVVIADASGTALRAGEDSAAVCVGVPGAGNLPPVAREALEDLRNADVPVIVTTRCPQGRLSMPPTDDLDGLGCLFSDRNLLQTRIKAVVALAADSLDDAFERMD